MKVGSKTTQTDMTDLVIPYNKETIIYSYPSRRVFLDGSSVDTFETTQVSSDLYYPDGAAPTGGTFRARVWFTIPRDEVSVTTEVEQENPLNFFTVFTTLFALVSTASGVFSTFVHHAPPARRKFMPRLHTSERAFKKVVESELEHSKISQRTIDLERRLEAKLRHELELAANFERQVEAEVADVLHRPSLHHAAGANTGLHDSASDDDDEV